MLGNTRYLNLNDALTEIKSSDTVKLLSNIELEGVSGNDAISIPTGPEVIAGQ